MPIVTNPTAAFSLGVIGTNSQLAAVSVVTVTENSVVQTLGGTAIGDGGGGTYFFQAASTRGIDSSLVIGTPTTGRWIAANSNLSFSGVGPVSASLTGYGENLVLLSGFAPLVYALPPSTSMIGELISVKDLTTGTITVRTANATDLIFDNSKTSPVLGVSSLTATLTGGYTFNFRATSGAYYRIDPPPAIA